MAPIFISFIHEEQDVAAAIKRLLEEKLQDVLTPTLAGRVFLSADDWQVFAGEIWLERIREELDSATVVVLLLSSRSVRRPWVNFEAGAAWLRKEKIIIPACFGGLTKDDLPKPYSGIQALNLPDEVYYLFRSIVHHLKDHQNAGLAGILPPPFPPDDRHVRELERAISGLGNELR